MAERRMVSKVISLSEKVNSLSLFGRLLYTWMIPHADDFGRLPGSPAKVRVMVVPFCDETIKDVERELADMNRIGIIRWYQVNGERFIQIVNFEEHQQGLHKRTKSKFPEPTEEETAPNPPENEPPKDETPVDSESFREFPGNSCEFPLNRTEGNRTEKKGIAAPTHAHTREETEEQTISSVHTNVFGTIMMSGLMSDFVQKLKTRGCSDEFIMEIMLETGETATSPNLRYLKSTAERWLAEGITSREVARSRRGTGTPKPTGNTAPVVPSSAVPSADETRKRLIEIEELKERKKQFLAQRAAAAEGVSHGT